MNRAVGNDPVLSSTKERFVLFPVKYPRLWDLYKSTQAVFWTAEEIDLSQDIKDWKSLHKNEQHFIKHILAFFAASDGIVNENLATRFSNEVQIPEARAFYTVQGMMETIHSETYSLLLDTYITDDDEKTTLFNAIETLPTIKKKADWALKWIDSDEPFSKRLIAFACVEGIFFSSSFCSIYWLKDRGLMPGLSFSNELISRDEAAHTDFAILLHDHLLPSNRIDQVSARKLIEEAVDIECEFATESLPVSLIGMNSEKMVQYVKFCADRLSCQAGFDKIYNVENPFNFMERISLTNKTNFHEKKVSNYAKFAMEKSHSFFDESF